MKYMHTLIKVKDLDRSLAFYQDVMGLVEVRRMEREPLGGYTLVFLAADGDVESAKSAAFAPTVELLYLKDEKLREEHAASAGHLAYRVDNIYDACNDLIAKGVPLIRPPRDGMTALFGTPDAMKVEFVSTERQEPCEPWLSMKDTDFWF